MNGRKYLYQITFLLSKLLIDEKGHCFRLTTKNIGEWLTVQSWPKKLENLFVFDKTCINLFLD